MYHDQLLFLSFLFLGFNSLCRHYLQTIKRILSGPYCKREKNQLHPPRPPPKKKKKKKKPGPLLHPTLDHFDPTVLNLFFIRKIIRHDPNNVVYIREKICCNSDRNSR